MIVAIRFAAAVKELKHSRQKTWGRVIGTVKKESSEVIHTITIP